MELYNVQLRTDLDEVVVLQVYAGDPMEAEFTAKSMVECGQAGTISNVLTKFFRLLTSNFVSNSLNVSLHLPQTSIHKVIICLLHTRHICILNFFSKQLHHKTIGIHQEVNQSHSE